MLPLDGAGDPRLHVSIVTRLGVFDVLPVFFAAATAARMSCSVFVRLSETRIFMKPLDLYLIVKKLSVLPSRDNPP